MSASSGVVANKLKFKGDKPKKKKRSHRQVHDGGLDEFAALAAADPQGWMFPEREDEVSGPSFIILPTSPPSCLAWDAQREKVYGLPLDLPEVPEGHQALSSSEVLAAVEPTAVDTVWVVSRVAGSDEVSLRTATGSFLTAHPSGTLSASAPSRGPLEAFKPTETLTEASPFPAFALKNQSGKFISIDTSTKAEPGLLSTKRFQLRADADEIGKNELFNIKCQREFVFKARSARDGESSKAKRAFQGGVAAGSVEDELRKNREAQAWGGGRSIVSEADRKSIKRAKKEGRVAEAMLDRRSALKSDRHAR